MTSCHITAAEVRHQQKSSGERERERERERESEIKREREREGRKRQPTEREREREIERELGIFSMMRFDSKTSSFLDLLVTKSYRKKLKVQNSKEKFPHFAVEKMFKNIFCLWIFVM